MSYQKFNSTAIPGPSARTREGYDKTSEIRIAIATACSGLRGKLMRMLRIILYCVYIYKKSFLLNEGGYI